MYDATTEPSFTMTGIKLNSNSNNAEIYIWTMQEEVLKTQNFT